MNCCRKRCLYQKLQHNSFLYFEHFIDLYERLRGCDVYVDGCVSFQKEVHLEGLIVRQVLTHTGTSLVYLEPLKLSVPCLNRCVVLLSSAVHWIHEVV